MLSSPAFADTTDYTTKVNHRPDGIGKIYMGREIAQVMGHQGAAWLERSARGLEERPQQAIDLLDLQPSDTVADIGAGTGYFAFRMAPQVKQVYAVDVQPEMLDIMAEIQSEKHIENVDRVLGANQNPNLTADTIDLALMVDAYHEFDYPKEMMQGLVTALKPGGRVALLEYKGENPLIPIKKLHKMTQRQVRHELEAVGLEFIENKQDLPQQHLLIFRKPV
ncbi:class I SAM-dependent methyltransferase [Romeriopsis navalis]|nr:class I SAM-dependent methyltransferase [Romeriopsis navalis]